jgi:hypothetical protein
MSSGVVSGEIVFTKEELDRIYKAILKVTLPEPVLDRLGYFLGQLDFCRMASPQFESKSKDTLKLSGQSVSAVCNEQCPLDKKVHLCTQTENGVSARAYQTCLHFAKALACFRGQTVAGVEDLRQIIPWVLHEKLVPNTRSGFFEAKGKRALLQDRVAWIRNMWDTAMEQFGKHEPTRRKVTLLRVELDQGLEGVERKTVEQRLSQVKGLLEQLMTKHELSGAVYEDIIQLKSIYSRYHNYAHWLKQNAAR